MTEDTICAIATAQGGALGVIRVSGPDAIRITSSIFHPQNTAKQLDLLKPYTLTFGQIKAGSEVVDEVLVSLFKAPHSYTGEDSTEISCHGSSYILQRILSLLIAAGCRMANPGEYTQRAFLNGKMDLSQAEAVADLIASHNASQHRIAMQQMRGGISQKLHQLRDQLLKLTSLLELELDFGDHEELEFADRSELNTLAAEVEQEIRRLTESFTTGNAIKNGIPVAIIGAPNVGKSTLLNQLLQDDKAIVSDIAGTTRDTIEDTITISGKLFRFIDTAGLHHTTNRIEQLGIERSYKAAEKAQIIILMRDPDNDYPTLGTQNGQQVIKIFNKTDKFQAINGTGVDQLKEQLLQAIPDQEDTSELLITNLRHYEALTLALEDIIRAEESLHANLSGDLVSEDLRQCLFHLADILGGQITSDEVLHNIFKHFCIGK